MPGTTARVLQHDESQQRSVAQRPFDRVKVGNVEIPIWRNEGSNGEFYKAGSPQITYKDADGNTQEGKNYGVMDLLALSKAADLAAERVMELSKGKGQNR